MTRARNNSFNPFNNQVAGKNIIINGGFDIWQRNTSFTGITAGNTYVADRWTTGTAGSYNIYVSRQPTGDIVNVPDIQYCLRFGRTSGTSGANWNTLNTSIETANSVPFAGKKITLSFYARAGANFSSSGNTLASFVLSGTGVDQNVAVSYTGQLYSYGGHTLTTSWQRFTNTYTVPTNATELSISLQYAPTGTAAANDYYEITGVQLEIGSSATVFSRAGGTIGGELSLCQRYYEHSYDSSTNSGTNGMIVTTMPTVSNAYIPIQFKVTKRSAPTMQAYDSANNVNRITTPAGVNQTFFAFERVGNSSVQLTTNSVSLGSFWLGWSASSEL